MNEKYDSELCIQIHKNLDKTIQNHGEWLKEHDNDINLIKQENANFKSDIKTLFNKIDNLISTIKWGLGISVTLFIFMLGILINK